MNFVGAVSNRPLQWDEWEQTLIEEDGEVPGGQNRRNKCTKPPCGGSLLD